MNLLSHFTTNIQIFFHIGFLISSLTTLMWEQLCHNRKNNRRNPSRTSAIPLLITNILIIKTFAVSNVCFHKDIKAILFSPPYRSHYEYCISRSS